MVLPRLCSSTEAKESGWPLVAAPLLLNHVESHAESKLLRHAQQQIAGLQWEVDPPVFETDAAMTRPIEQIVAQQFAQVVQDSGIAGGMETVATVVHPDSVQLEAAGIAAHGVPLFEDGHAGAAEAGQFVGSADSGRTRAEDYDVRQAGLLCCWSWKGGRPASAGLHVESSLSDRGQLFGGAKPVNLEDRAGKGRPAHQERDQIRPRGRPR